MSATIKPAGYKCPNCNQLVRGPLDCDCIRDAEPLFTRADLVAAVAMGQKVHEDCDPEIIVDEMLAGNEAAMLGEQKGGG